MIKINQVNIISKETVSIDDSTTERKIEALISAI